MALTKRERYFKVFEKYMALMKGKSEKWFIPGYNKQHDKKIHKFINYYAVPVKQEDVIIFLDTTVFRTAKEGFLFTTEGIVVKVAMEKLFYLKYSMIENADLQEFVDEAGIVTSKIRINFKDGTSRNVLDYDVKKYAFVDYINDAVVLTDKITREEARGH